MKSASKPSQSSPTLQTSPFLSLPAEIRNMIYTLAIRSSSLQDDLPLTTLQQPASSLACKQMLREILPIFSAGNYFFVHIRSNYVSSRTSNVQSFFATEKYRDLGRLQLSKATRSWLRRAEAMAGKIRIKKIRFIARSFSQRAELCYVSLLVHPNPVRFAVSTEIQETYFNRQHRHVSRRV